MNGPATLLAQRLHGLNADINRLREQQRTLARLLAASPALHACRSKADWVALLRAAGFSDADMQRWHEDFERADPDGHARFLQSIGLAPDEAGEVRRRSVVARLPPR